MQSVLGGAAGSTATSASWSSSGRCLRVPEEHRLDHAAGRPDPKRDLVVRFLRAYDHVAAFDRQYVIQGDALPCQRRNFHAYPELGSSV